MEIRRSYDRLISTMGFLYWQDDVFILNQGPDCFMEVHLPLHHDRRPHKKVFEVRVLNAARTLGLPRCPEYTSDINYMATDGHRGTSVHLCQEWELPKKSVQTILMLPNIQFEITINFYQNWKFGTLITPELFTNNAKYGVAIIITQLTNELNIPMACA